MAKNWFLAICPLKLPLKTSSGRQWIVYGSITLKFFLWAPLTQSHHISRNGDYRPKKSFWGTPYCRPRRWSIFQSDGMVNVFFQATIDFNGFSMVLTTLDHHHWMFFEGPTIWINGFSMVFKILRAMVNDGFEVNNCLDVQLQKVRKINLRTNANFEQNM